MTDTLISKTAEKIDQLYDSVYAEASLTDEVIAILESYTREVIGKTRKYKYSDPKEVYVRQLVRQGQRQRAGITQDSGEGKV